MFSNRQSLQLSDSQIRFIRQRIDTVEKSMADLCQKFAAYSRKVARLRDKGDELSKSLLSFAENENLCHTLQAAMVSMADNLALVQDYRNSEVHRLEAKVVDRTVAYEALCNQARDELRRNNNAKTQEVRRRLQLERALERTPTHWQQLSQPQAENDLYRASTNTLKTNTLLETQIDEFEQRKLIDLKAILLDFATIELLFHSKSMEIYTAIYNDLLKINEEQDLEEFRTCLQTPTLATRVDTLRGGMFHSPGSTQSLNESIYTYGRHQPLRHTVSNTDGMTRSFSSNKVRLSRSAENINEITSDVKSIDEPSDNELSPIGSRRPRSAFLR